MCLPLASLQLFEAVNAGALTGGTLHWAEFGHRLEQLSSFLLRRNDGSRMLNHASFREWLMWREEGQDDRFLCDPRCTDWQGDSEREKDRRRKRKGFSLVSFCFCLFSRSGHTLMAFWFCRQEGMLNRQQTLELGHHILKAHIYKVSLLT